MRRQGFLSLFAAAAALLAPQAPAQQQANVPSQPFERALNTQVIADLNRSVELARTIPPVRMQRPPVDEAWAVKVGEAVYVDRRLLPERAVPGEGEIRVFPRDARRAE